MGRGLKEPLFKLVSLRCSNQRLLSTIALLRSNPVFPCVLNLALSHLKNFPDFFVGYFKQKSCSNSNSVVSRSCWCMFSMRRGLELSLRVRNFNRRRPSALRVRDFTNLSIRRTSKELIKRIRLSIRNRTRRFSHFQRGYIGFVYELLYSAMYPSVLSSILPVLS
jgi:hypothetical protein